jgi:hypothetical protein
MSCVFPLSLMHFEINEVKELFAVSQLYKCGLILILFYVEHPFANVSEL